MNLRRKTNRFPARLNSYFRPVKANDCNGRKRRLATPTRGSVAYFETKHKSRLQHYGRF